MQIHGFGPPEAPTVVLVHGAPDRSTGFRRVLPHLPELRLLTYDRRGYGESSEMTLAGSLVDHANDLIDLLADRPAVAVGHSFGGNVALLAAGMRPDLVRAVGVWETSMCWLSGWPAEHRESVRRLAESPDTEALGEQMAKALLGPNAWDGLAEKERALRRVEGRAFAADMGFLLERRFELSGLEVPFVHGLGGDTAGVHLDAAPLISGESGVLPVVVEGTSHLIHTQAPEKWASFVRAAVAAADRR